MPEEPRQPEERDNQRPTEADPHPRNPPEAAEETTEDMVEEDRFEATDN
jgi:hypothetical protein